MVSLTWEGCFLQWAGCPPSMICYNLRVQSPKLPLTQQEDLPITWMSSRAHTPAPIHARKQKYFNKHALVIQIFFFEKKKPCSWPNMRYHYNARDSGRRRYRHSKVSKQREEKRLPLTPSLTFSSLLLPFPNSVTTRLAADCEIKQPLFGNRGTAERVRTCAPTCSDSECVRVCVCVSRCMCVYVVGGYVCVCVCDSSWREWAERGEPGNLGGVPVNRAAGRGLE